MNINYVENCLCPKCKSPSLYREEFNEYNYLSDNLLSSTVPEKLKTFCRSCNAVYTENPVIINSMLTIIPVG